MKLKELTNIEINEILNNNNKFHGCYSKDIIPKKLKYGYYIINLDNHLNGGTHWTCMFINNERNIYFDSFGFVAPNEVESRIKPYVYNTLDLQQEYSSSCGWWCIDYITYMSKYNKNYYKHYADYINKYTSNAIYNEKLLSNHFN
jgi:hypothetical protein